MRPGDTPMRSIMLQRLMAVFQIAWPEVLNFVKPHAWLDSDNCI